MPRILLGLAAALLLVYAADTLSVRLETPKSRTLLETVQIERYYAVRLKDGKTEFMYADPETQVCVNSLFPQAGHQPCWYVKRNKRKRIDI